MRRSRILKVKKSLLELKQYFKPINVSVDVVDKLEEKKYRRREPLQKPLGMISTIG